MCALRLTHIPRASMHSHCTWHSAQWHEGIHAVSRPVNRHVLQQRQWLSGAHTSDRRRAGPHVRFMQRQGSTRSLKSVPGSCKSQLQLLLRLCVCVNGPPDCQTVAALRRCCFTAWASSCCLLGARKVPWQGLPYPSSTVGGSRGQSRLQGRVFRATL